MLHKCHRHGGGFMGIQGTVVYGDSGDSHYLFIVVHKIRNCDTLQGVILCRMHFFQNDVHHSFVSFYYLTSGKILLYYYRERSLFIWKGWGVCSIFCKISRNQNCLHPQIARAHTRPPMISWHEKLAPHPSSLFHPYVQLNICVYKKGLMMFTIKCKNCFASK